MTGDDLLPRLDQLLADGERFTNLDTGEALATVRERVVSANAYLGARPLAEALRRGASVVISGRVADASLTVAPAVHELGWSWDDWHSLSAATIAGHLIECGAQATGGLWCNWQDCPDLANAGYPIAEINADAEVHHFESLPRRAAPSTAKRSASSSSTKSETLPPICRPT